MSEVIELKSGPTQSETLFGGVDIVIAHDGSPGAAETVRVRQLKIGEYPQLLRGLDNEEAMAELYCAKPAGWAAGLPVQSLEAIVMEGERVNGDFFSRWVLRRLARQEKLVPGLAGKMADAVLQSQQANLAASPSPNGAPK